MNLQTNFTRKVVKPKKDRRFRNIRQALLHIKGFAGFPLYLRRIAMCVCAKEYFENKAYPDRTYRFKDSKEFTLEYDTGLETGIYLFICNEAGAQVVLFEGNKKPIQLEMATITSYRLKKCAGDHQLTFSTMEGYATYYKQHGAKVDTLKDKLLAVFPDESVVVISENALPAKRSNDKN